MQCSMMLMYYMGMSSLMKSGTRSDVTQDKPNGHCVHDWGQATLNYESQPMKGKGFWLLFVHSVGIYRNQENSWLVTFQTMPYCQIDISTWCHHCVLPGRDDVPSVLRKFIVVSGGSANLSIRGKESRAIVCISNTLGSCSALKKMSSRWKKPELQAFPFLFSSWLQTCHPELAIPQKSVGTRHTSPLTQYIKVVF